MKDVCGRGTLCEEGEGQICSDEDEDEEEGKPLVAEDNEHHSVGVAVGTFHGLDVGTGD